MNIPSLPSRLFPRSACATLFAMLFGLSAFAPTASAAERSGKEVVETVCIVCHGPGKDGAPRIGNTSEWAKHAAQGLSVMTQNAITGIRKMPAHGGQGELTDLEISRAMSYMVSGGTTVDPNKPYSSPGHMSGELLVKVHCQDCHAAGKDGAPRIDSMSDWQPRLQKGVEQLIQSAIHGHNAMPARSGWSNLSDTDLRAAVTYMVTQAAAKTQK